MAAIDYAGAAWDLYVGSDKILGVTEVSMKHGVDTSDIKLINNASITVDGVASSSWEVSIADLGQANLSKILPNNVLTAGTQIPGQATGVVATTGEDGVITFGTKDCAAVEVTDIVRLVPCGKPQHTEWLFDAIATLTGKEIHDGVMIYTVTLRSNSTGVQSAKGQITTPA